MFDSTRSLLSEVLKNKTYCKKRATDLIKLTGHTSILPREIYVHPLDLDYYRLNNVISNIQPSIIIFNQVFEEISNNSININDIQQLFLNIKKKRGKVLGSDILNTLRINFDNAIILFDLENNQQNELYRSITSGPLANYDLIMGCALFKNILNTKLIKDTSIENILNINYYEPTNCKYFYFTLKRTRLFNFFNATMIWI